MTTPGSDVGGATEALLFSLCLGVCLPLPSLPLLSFFPITPTSHPEHRLHPSCPLSVDPFPRREVQREVPPPRRGEGRMRFAAVRGERRASFEAREGFGARSGRRNKSMSRGVSPFEERKLGRCSECRPGRFTQVWVISARNRIRNACDEPPDGRRTRASFSRGRCFAAALIL